MKATQEDIDKAINLIEEKGFYDGRTNHTQEELDEMNKAILREVNNMTFLMKLRVRYLGLKFRLQDWINN